MPARRCRIIGAMSKNSSDIVADARRPDSGYSQVPTGQKIKAGLGVVALLALVAMLAVGAALRGRCFLL